MNIKEMPLGDGDEKLAIIKYLKANGREHAIEHCEFYSSALSFYKGCRLLYVIDNEARKKHSTSAYFETYIIADGSEYILLKWANNIVYELNSRLGKEERLIFNRRTVSDYARFFFHVVRGQLGRFIIVETVDDVPWLASATSDDKAKVAAKLRPMRYDGIYKLHYYKLDAIVVFKNALFRTDIVVAPYAWELRWSRLSEQIFRFDKWSLCRG